ncbi:MAG: DUF3299 domain-containing protein [Sphingomonadaceae bacterium]|uniref:DUF3299 domain-containing protein n=1 Tax=Thermaurantiacus sp. TaxID=2820283 RepID=UPI00298F0D61|nr:DUF3299 domain-containing protein [Thermaurantiacus sp.]MCS6987345.1 DUF3299 domain-containing protein [Sphingomonadaceae bacterium]MDW8414566.1 DUF3299 domain-containing protein [Thermaurantiacus sp.]
MRRLFVALALLSAAPAMALQPGGQLEDVWKPAATPQGGIPWKLLESTGETTRVDAHGFLRSKPVFPPGVRALQGKRVKVAGFMMPLENAAKQSHFVLLAYPPGCPFHLHAGPNQFIEVRAATPFPVEVERAVVVEGILELTGEDESGVFYRLLQARPG